MPLLSVVVPVYNVEPYLAECLDSLLVQTFKDMEIICVNDGSTDNSGIILDRYAEQYPNIIKVITQENKGPAAARNVGMAVARGSFMTFADSDDTLVPHAYERAMDYFTDDVDSVCFGTELLYEITDISHDDLENIKNDNADFFAIHAQPSGEKYTVPFEKISSLNWCIWNKIYRTNILKKNKIMFQPEVFYHEDLFFHSCFFAAAPNTYLLPQQLYRYRIRSYSFIDTFRRGNHSCNIYLIVMMRYLYDFYHKLGLFPAYTNQFISLGRERFDQAFPGLEQHEKARAIYETAKLFKENDLPMPPRGDQFYCAVSGEYTLQWGRNRFAELCLMAVNQIIYSWNKMLSTLCVGKYKELLRRKYRLARLNIKELKR